jgi:hypothetical protein
LLIALARPSAYDVAELLLTRGANPSALVNTYRGPMTPLRLAAEAGDARVARMLLDRGADSKAMGGVVTLLSAISSGDDECVKLLFPLAERKAFKDAATFLVPPFTTPPAPSIVRKFFECGADPTISDHAGRTLLMLATTSENASLETIQTLLQHGAELNATAADGRTALDFARLQGHTPVVELLLEKGALTGNDQVEPLSKPNPAVSIRAAVERSLPLLQATDVAFLKRSGCVSCHNNSLTAMTIAAARKAGLAVDEKTAERQRKEIGDFIEIWRERALQNIGVPGDSNTVDYILAGLAAEHYPPDEATDALARYLKNDQLPDGRWRLIANRPPLESSEFEVAAMAMRSIQVYAPKSQRADYDKAVWRAANWMRTARPRTTADRAFQLLGLSWAGDNAAALEAMARELLSEQRADGGWAQLRTMESDAYATGQAMTALNWSGVVPASDDAYRRGAEYLKSTQLQDGSWHVRSRAIPFQPYFESGFPHGHDQWISAAATNWATMALIPAVR